MTGLQMTAMVGMIDPPRAESKDAVRNAQSANIRVRMVTGDDVITGEAIARQLGIEGEAILGADFAALSEEERLSRIDGIGVVGRVAPEHKVLMVETLRKKGDVVAMTGDGVNDAPAIKSADIGIAMGTGTQVAKNAAKMILTDDNFATIVKAVSEGRKLYDNMLKYIRFMMVALVTYVVTFLLASLLNIAGGQPFSAVQILWINFVITAPVGIALGLDKETPGLMRRRPRPRTESIMSRPVLITVGLAGLFMSVAIDLLIVFGKDYYDNVEIGSTIGLVAFSLMLVVAALECRDQTATILREETLNNNTVNLAIVAEIVLALLIGRGGALTSLLDTQHLTGRQWLFGALPAVLLFVLWELGKLIARRAAESVPAGGARRRDGGGSDVMKSYRYVVADVFTDTPLTGNQLAVFTDARALDDETMQALALEVGFSETVFVLSAGERRQRQDPDLHADLRAPVRRPSDPRHGLRARRAAPARRDHARDRPRQRARQARARRVGPHRLRPDGAAGADDRAPPGTAGGAGRGRRCRLRAAGRALRQRRQAFIFVALGSEERGRGPAARTARRSTAFGGHGRELLRGLRRPLDVADVLGAWRGRRHRLAAAGPLACHLARHGRIAWGDEITISQGAAIGRPSTLYARAEGGAGLIDRVEVGGQAVTVARGEFRL